MDERYLSFWTVLFWIAAGAAFALAALMVTPAGSQVERKGRSFVSMVVVGLIFFVIGFVTRGSRNADRLEEATRSALRAQAALEATPLAGTEALLASCKEAKVLGKAKEGGSLVECRQFDGTTITFRMP